MQSTEEKELKKTNLSVEMLKKEEINQSYEIVMFIINSSKLFLEKYFFDEENDESLKKLKENLKDNHETYKEFRDFNLNLFDETFNYYYDLKKYFIYDFEFLCEPNEDSLDKVKNYIKSNISIYYLSVLLDLLLEILNKNKSAHEDPIIKFDISVICELFREKNERLCSSHSFFYCCANELSTKYGINLPGKNKYRQKVFEKYKDKAIKTLKKVKNNLYKYIRSNLNDYLKILFHQKEKKKIYIKNDEDENEYNTINNKYNSLKEILSDKNLINNDDELKNWCEKNNIRTYLNDYAKYLSAKKYFASKFESEAYKNKILNNCLLPLEILNIDLKNEENIFIISCIDFNEKINYSEKSYPGETFYEQYLDIKEEMNYKDQKCYEDEIETIIKSDAFLKELISILKSESVSSYFQSVIKFKNDDKYNYEVKLLKVAKINGEIEQNSLFDLKLKGDLYLGEQFDIFIKNFESNYENFKKLIVLKELGYKIPSCTGPSMRIFINPRIHFSKVAFNNKNNREEILKSALIILLIHEIIHLLKYYPINEKYPEISPITPKNKENGKCLIYYLFDKDVVQKINYNQALEINKVNNWDDLDILHKIFEQESNYNEIEKEKGEIDLYLSDSKNEKNKKYGNKNKTDYCWW